jgi:hypothetical protein
MNTANPSNAAELPLADIHLPNMVSAWPPAIGWWLLTALIIALLIAAIILIKRYRTKWGYRKAALRLLDQQYKDHSIESHSDAMISIQSMLALLKRTAISAYPQQNIRARFGEQWVVFLNRQTHKHVFNTELANILVAQQYQENTNSTYTEVELSTLHTSIYKACRTWIKQHNTRYQEEAL